MSLSLGAMRISDKLVLSSLMFSLPIAVLLYFTVIGLNGYIDFARAEKQGNAMLRPLMALLEETRLAGAAARQGGPGAAADVENRLTPLHSEMARLYASLGPDLQFTPEGLAKRGRERLTPDGLRGRLQAAARELAAGSGGPAVEILAADLREMITHAGDASNLILDPDLDSYYLMDVTLLALPQAQDRLGQAAAFALQALAKGGSLSQDDRLQLLLFASHLQDSDLSRIKVSAQTALNEDPNFYGSSPSLARNVKPALDRYAVALTAFIEALRRLAAAQAGAPSGQDIRDRALAALQAGGQGWKASVAELDVLLDIRMAGYAGQRLTALVCTALAIAVAVVFVYVIGRGVIRPLEAIAGYAHAVAQGDLNAALRDGFSPELSAMARDIQAMVASLKDQLGFAQGILTGVTLPLIVVDGAEKITFVNEAAISFFEREGRPEDFLGWTTARFVPGDAARETTLGQAIQARQAIRGRLYDFVTPDGGSRHAQFDAAPLFDLDGKLLGGFAIMTDLTAMREREQLIADQNQTITQAAQRAEEIARDVSQASDNLARRVRQAREGAAVQRRRAEETATAMEQMSATILEVARNATDATSNADEARHEASDGLDVSQRLGAAMDDMRRQSEELRQTMLKLDDQAGAIGVIMQFIQDIADQTNLLALNAAIEAARAGDAGRGFAVVADEVRKLAEKTMTATQEVGQAVQAIQDGARDSAAATQAAAESIQRGAALAERSGQMLRDIVSKVEISASQIGGIAAASEQQSAASRQISAAAEDVSRISGDTAEAMEDAWQAIASLTELSAKLRRAMERVRA